ncbi:hypothetical protein AB6713_00080 [Luteimonas sp. B3_2_R+30]|uniref:Uncharacterized protein n=2 Tax=Luteimonas salinilitoris TaxID=3237697 RepID=A0ABV4HJW2_9GAMM
MNRILAVVIGATFFVSLAYAGSQGFRLDAHETFKDGDRVEAIQATLTTSTNDQVTADYAAFVQKAAQEISGALGLPYVVELYGTVKLDIDGMQAYTDAARYYPELNTFATEHFNAPFVNEKFATVGCTASGNQVQVTYANGTVLTGDTACVGGAGYSCSGGQLNSLGAC